MVNITHVRSSHLPPLLPNLYLLTFEIFKIQTLFSKKFIILEGDFLARINSDGLILKENRSIRMINRAVHLLFKTDFSTLNTLRSVNFD